jgi:two-component system cell cycle response regulator CpdR
VTARRGGRVRIIAKILVAEDDQAVSAFVTRALSHAGHDVVAVPDGLAALDALAADSYELLLTDIVMPGLDGIALALKVSKEFPAMRILLMTGFSAERQRAHNLEALIHRVISKPFTLEEICSAVDEALA